MTELTSGSDNSSYDALFEAEMHGQIRDLIREGDGQIAVAKFGGIAVSRFLNAELISDGSAPREFFGLDEFVIATEVVNAT